jgi:hypothetical protein
MSISGNLHVPDQNKMEVSPTKARNPVSSINCLGTILFICGGHNVRARTWEYY